MKLYETILQTYPRLNEKCSPWTATEKLGAKDSLLGFDVWKFPPLSSQVIGDKIGELVCTLTLVEFERAKATQRNQTRLKTWWISFRIWIVISTISLRLFEEAKYGNIVKHGRMCCSFIQHNLNLMVHLIIKIIFIILYYTDTQICKRMRLCHVVVCLCSKNLRGSFVPTHIAHKSYEQPTLPQNLSLFRPSFWLAARFLKEHMTCPWWTKDSLKCLQTSLDSRFQFLRAW